MIFGIRTRLGILMFLQFYIWGGWFVTLGSYLAATLHATGAQIGLAYSTQSWGAIIAPLVAGLLADRFINAERLLGVVHLIGGGLLYFTARASSFGQFYPCLLLYMILFMPTLALANAVAFYHLLDPASQFSRMRVWGTFGWIAAGLVISYVFGWDSSIGLSEGRLRNTFLMCAAVSSLLGLYSFTLPATPPSRRESRITVSEILNLEAFELLASRSFLIFFVASILICVPLAFYYQEANQFLIEIHLQNPTAKQTLGQVSEVGFMLLMPMCLSRFGMKTTLLVGMAAWAARYALFAFGNAQDLVWMILIGIALHGVCYDFFFVSGQIFTDFKAGIRGKAAAQGLITMATYGLGMLMGFSLAGAVSDAYSNGSSHEWRAIWMYPSVFAVLVFIAFAFLFKNEKLTSASERAQ